MNFVILVVEEQLNFGIVELISQYVKSVQKRIKFQNWKNAIRNINH